MSTEGANARPTGTIISASYPSGSKKTMGNGSGWNWFKTLAFGLVLSMLDLERDKTQKDRLLRDAVVWNFRAQAFSFKGKKFHFPGPDQALRQLAYGFNFLKYKQTDRFTEADPLPTQDQSFPIQRTSFPIPAERAGQEAEIDWESLDQQNRSSNS